jgi:signal transduction histidine kinase
MTTLKKKKLLIFTLAAILFAGLVFLTTNISKKNNSSEIIRDNFESTLNARFEKSENFAVDFLENEISQNSELFLESSFNTPEDFGLLVYKNTSLIYWTDNSFIEKQNNSDFQNTDRIQFKPNGIYQYHYLQSGEYKIVISDLIKNKYPYENSYLTASFHKAYNIPASWIITNEITDYPIRSSEGKILFFLKDPSSDHTSTSGLLLIWIFGLLFLLFAVIALYALYERLPDFYHNRLYILLFVLDVFIIRFFIFYFKIPSKLYLSDLFDPSRYASSIIFPNLGDTLISLFVLLLSAAFCFNYSRKFKARENLSKWKTLLASVLSYLFIIKIFYFAVYTIDSVFINSTFQLDFSYVLNFTLHSYLGFVAIGITLATFLLISFPLLKHILSQYSIIKTISGLSLIYISLIYITQHSGIYSPDAVYVIFLLVYILLTGYFINGKRKIAPASFVLLSVLILTGVSGYSHYKNLDNKEKNERKLIAVRISSDRDNIAEYLFADMEKAIQADADLRIMISAASVDFSLEKEIKSYMRNSYFKGYWNRYMAQITVCYPDKILRIKPTDYEIGCDDFFDEIIGSLAKPTISPNLYYISESYDVSSYIAQIPVKFYDEGPIANIVIEFYKKYVPKGLGYPELLLDKSVTAYSDITGYSYAIFAGNELVKNVGDYNYSEFDASSIDESKDGYFYDRQGFNHYVYKIENGRTIIISKKKSRIIDKLTPFTYQLTFHILVALIVFLAYTILRSGLKIAPDLKTRLQLMMIALILFASAIIGMVTLNNIIQQNNKKNQDILSEKAHSVLIELEHKLASTDILDESERDYLQELLTKFSLIFFSDINLYDPEGTLMASSRKEIFSEGLKSVKMQREAFTELAINKRTLFIMEEKIGSYQYLSAYIPFRNNQNKTTAFINLPYFARQQEIQQEISTFLVTIINIYVILTALAIIISLVVANHLTRPLQMIRDRFSKLNLSTGIEKIEYSREDELGDLINEYNLMVEKLAESAAQLARSERESAWREMARQVAHEIKNPLTPMKLSIQHLQKAWNDNAPDWQMRLDRTTKTLIQQIDSLSAIASAFSDFAKLPTAKNLKLDLSAILRTNIGLFSNYPNINMVFNLPENPSFVYADEKQLSRVFINLFTNAMQAIPTGSKGLITISIKTMNQKHQIIIQDNGIGMSEDQQNKVFSPNFTTKSSGMGLGLAMVKNIVESVNGNITFSSREGFGTTFVIELPEYSADN